MVFEQVLDLLEYFFNLMLILISSTGYWGIFVLMALESAVMPVPSEVVMPFAGYLVYQGQLDLLLVTLAGTFGNLFGSLIAYFFGLYFGRRFILKYGKYVLLKEKYLIMTENWFKKYGDKAIFFSRLLPVVRTVISLPAGIGRMNLRKFTIYTFIGSFPWSFLWAYVGLWLGQNWEIIRELTKYNILLFGLMIAVIIWYLWSHRKNKK